MRRILCLIPAHNEAANLAAVVAEVRSRRPDLDILVVDDGSTDWTMAVVPTLGVRWLTDSLAGCVSDLARTRPSRSQSRSSIDIGLVEFSFHFNLPRRNRLGNEVDQSACGIATQQSGIGIRRGQHGDGSPRARVQCAKCDSINRAEN